VADGRTSRHAGLDCRPRQRIAGSGRKAYGEAVCLPMAHDFLRRMAWLPDLLVELDRPYLDA
jgi:hypothetical protein